MVFVHQTKQVSLAVMAAQDAFGVAEDGCVEESFTSALQKRARQEDSVRSGQGCHLGKETCTQLIGMLCGVVQGVAAAPQFWQDNQVVT
jgi:hypothetical protein